MIDSEDQQSDSELILEQLTDNNIADLNIIPIGNIYPFMIYDKRKLHGYIYDPIDRLYHFTDRHSLRKFTSRNHESPQFLEKDIRLMMDVITNAIPINCGSMISCITQTLTSNSNQNELQIILPDLYPHESVQDQSTKDRLSAEQVISKANEILTTEGNIASYTSESSIVTKLSHNLGSQPIADNKHPQDNLKLVIRKRTPDDYFTYELQVPNLTKRIINYMKILVPNKSQREILHKFLQLSLITYTPKSCLVIRGTNESKRSLFRLLLTLDPIIKKGRSALYREAHVNKTTLDEVHQARIVLCDIGDSTLRIADPPFEKEYLRPVQYHGIVAQNKQLDDLPKHKIIHMVEVYTHTIFTSGEVLGWILQ